MISILKAHCHPPINDRSIANASCTAIGPPPLKSRPSLQAQVSKTMKIRRLDTCQNQISEQLLGTEDAVQEYLDDMEDAENYRDRYIEICTRVDLKIRETVVPTETEKEALNYRKSN
ncbi:uncharacterized protein TNCV_2506911 [Trichonephila clavipes]|uniref:Uncharacterized protein n=1 Tax=Trichonephila clavipes TaxID=2585209 RepID=A0A8X6WG17_TRICX|nr:uncharacterized protein TNCV_2506911 [Trichonephila clavipes]